MRLKGKVALVTGGGVGTGAAVAERFVAEGPKATAWNPLDATLIRAVDELYYDTFITDATWNALAKRYSQQQLMDVIATVGGYNLLAMFLNSLGVQLDEGVPGFPKGKDK